MVENVTIVRDSTLTFRGIIASGITDPISRTGNESFVMTSWPTRDVKYPIITVEGRIGPSDRLGARPSESQRFPITLEATVWAKDVKTRDILAGSLVEVMRRQQYTNDTSSGTIFHDLNHFRFLTQVNIPPEPSTDEQTKDRIHRTVLSFGYDYYTK